jgi:hypothetical protein
LLKVRDGRAYRRVIVQQRVKLAAGRAAATAAAATAAASPQKAKHGCVIAENVNPRCPPGPRSAAAAAGRRRRRRRRRFGAAAAGAAAKRTESRTPPATRAETQNASASCITLPIRSRLGRLFFYSPYNFHHLYAYLVFVRVN